MDNLQPTGVYAPLAEYLAGITFDDLRTIGDYETIKAIPPKHRLLMVRYLKEITEQIRLFGYVDGQKVGRFRDG